MIKLKKYTALTLCALTLTTTPLSALADEYDQKIADQDKKISDLQQTEQSAEDQKAALEQQVAAVEQEVNAVLKEKTNEEKKLSDLTAKIATLQEKIQKREEQIRNQARDVQTKQDSGSIVDAVINSKSLGEAVKKTMAVSTILTASKNIMEQQTKDKAELEKLEKEAEQRLQVINKKTTELKAKQEQLVQTKLDQQVKINEIQASIATEKDQKDKFEKQKEDAEKKRQAALKALEEQRKKEEEAREKAQAEAEKQAKKAAEEAQEAAEEAEKQAAEAETAKQKQEAEIAQLEAQKQEQEAKQQQEQAQTVTDAGASQVTTNPTTSTSNTSKPAATSSGWASPLSIGLVVTSPFGPRQDPTGASGTQHDGIDFAGSAGTPIMASKGGTVVEAGFHWSAGNHVVIQHSDGYYSYYMHMVSAPSVGVGSSVSAGQVLGGMGTTGNSTGVHLHFGVSTALWSGFVNPASLLGI
ncbi:peptidoglycan DD-metalloendopeptidase family protein [Enterococcus avium]|uniref:peptidoglycan DD-metalloendopeptidase family protein n=1 Tax=Enterococcus avium TaxID=33945 RepID=UPI00288CABBC|nr:peptidoglycan DD-metalloendopeptidase family protein [Enterococcus avium]MDT2434403.1 peptidoglycan DD-metalloendopeptidase family protein [Enterococcus avium]MDT2482260.1 peptidoglycan DD-metalloendopeptidase family protein [Enterococcus avium]MDT2508869.1 peptidoglycan DD-metalloendopeptidase family protein [Enterococcus avium]